MNQSIATTTAYMPVIGIDTLNVASDVSLQSIYALDTFGAKTHLSAMMRVRTSDDDGIGVVAIDESVESSTMMA